MTSTEKVTATAASEKSRVFGPGSRRLALLAGALLGLSSLALGVLLLRGHAGPPEPRTRGSSARSEPARTRIRQRRAANVTRSPAASAPSSAKYGGLPSWLPKPKVEVGRILSASAAHPVLAIQGDTISAHLAGARVLVTAVGPEVPQEGHFPVARTSPCTFVVTYAAPSGAIPIHASDFTILDELGVLHRPRVTSMSGAPAPKSVSPGRPVSLTLHDVLPTGNGRLRWAPEGERPIISWDFDVEID